MCAQPCALSRSPRCSRPFLQLKEECVALRTHVWEEVRKAQECLCRTQHKVDGDGCDVWVWSFHAIQCLLECAHSLECIDSLLSLSLVVPGLLLLRCCVIWGMSSRSSKSHQQRQHSARHNHHTVTQHRITHHHHLALCLAAVQHLASLTLWWSGCRPSPPPPLGCAVLNTSTDDCHGNSLSGSCCMCVCVCVLPRSPACIPCADADKKT